MSSIGLAQSAHVIFNLSETVIRQTRGLNQAGCSGLRLLQVLLEDVSLDLLHQGLGGLVQVLHHVLKEKDKTGEVIDLTEF